MRKGSKSLKQWCEEHEEFGNKLLSECTGIDAEGNKHDINDIPYASPVRLLWRCAKGHEWTVSVGQRTYYMTNCPHCTRMKNTIDFYTWCQNNGEIGAQFLSECTGIDEEGNKHDIHDISYSSHTKMLWRCSKGHEWYVSVGSRTSNLTNCKFCARMKNTIDFYTWCQNNGEIGKQFEEQYTGIDAEGNKHDINDISYGSNVELWWRCSKGHKWIASIVSRTSQETKCPHCTANKTSFPEQFIYWAFKQIYPQAISRGKHGGYEYDIAIPEIHTCIEYSPTHWHKYKFDKDQAKAEHCKAHNVNFIYIMEDSYNEYEETWTKNFICFHMPRKFEKQACIKLADYLLNLFNHSISEININLVEKNALEYSKGKVEYEKSIAYLYPDLAKEWHPTNQIQPDEITKGSGKEIYWKCPNCGYGSNGEWQTTVANRTINNTGCPCCGYNYTDGKCHKPAIQKASKNNNLKKDLPELAKEWHPTLNNPIQPDEITKSSHKVIYWICPNCAYGSNGEWKATANTRVNCKTRCPCCGYSWYKAMLGEPQKLRDILYQLNFSMNHM